MATGPVVPESARLAADDVGEWTVYRVRGRDCVGYVVAGAVVCAEDEGEYYEPSTLLKRLEQ